MSESESPLVVEMHSVVRNATGMAKMIVACICGHLTSPCCGQAAGLLAAAARSDRQVAEKASTRARARHKRGSALALLQACIIDAEGHAPAQQEENF